MSDDPLAESDVAHDAIAEAKPPTAPVGRWVGWLAVVSFVWICDLPLSDWMMGNRGFNDLQFYLLVGFCLSQIAIASLWLALGRSLLLVRLGALIITVGVWNAGSYVRGFSVNPANVHREKLIFIFSLISASFITFWLIARVFGCEIIRQRRGGEVVEMTSRRKWQFSLHQLFALTTAAAIVAGILAGGYIVLPSNVPWKLLVVAALIGLNGNLTAWTMLCVGWAGRIGAIGVSLLASIALAAIDTRESIEISIIMQFCILLTLLPVRLLGYRLRFGRRTPNAARPISDTSNPLIATAADEDIPE